MATILKGSIKRAIKVHGLESPVVVEITERGIEVRVPGQRITIGASWLGLVNAMVVPDAAPSFLKEKPLEFLKFQIQRRSRRIHHAAD
jgi:hypothetical protein